MTNTFLDISAKSILVNKGKEWLDEETNKHSFVLLYFFTDNSSSIKNLVQFNKYITSNQSIKKNNGAIYGIYSDKYDINKLLNNIQLNFDIIRNESCDLGYLSNMTITNNKIIHDGVCMYVNKKYFITNAYEKMERSELLYQIKYMMPNNDKSRSVETIKNDNTKYNQWEYQLCKPMPKEYVLTYGNLIKDFKNDNYTKDTGILHNFPGSHNIIKCVNMIYTRVKEEILFADKTEKFKESAIKRLMRDYKEIQMNPIDGLIPYMVSDSNMFEWHVNINAPNNPFYEDIVFHLEIVFTPFYPLRSPKIRALPTLPHPNIFSDYICMDLLSDYYGDNNNTKYGWSTAYSLYSILITLQAFINDGLLLATYGPDEENDNTIENHNKNIFSKIRRIQEFKCKCASSNNDMCKITTHEEVFGKITPDFSVLETSQNKNKFIEYAFDKVKIANQINTINRESKKYDSLIGKNIWGTVIKVLNFGTYVDIKNNSATCFVPTGEYTLDNIPKIGDEINMKIINVIEKPSKNRFLKEISITGSIKDCVEESEEITMINIQKSMKNKIVKGKVSEIVDNYGVYFVLDNEATCFVKYNDILGAYRPYVFFSLDDVMKIGDKFILLLKERGYTSTRETFYIGLIQDIEKPQIKSFIKKSYDKNTDDIRRRYEQNLICFHSKKSYKEDTLGIGVTIEYYSNGTISNINPVCLDMLSRESFESGIRTSAWKESFTHWLPLYISKEHAGDLKIHEKYIELMFQNKFNGKQERNIVPFKFTMVSKILPALMNTFVVTIMKDNMHESLNALSMYIQIFRLLIAFCEKYPEIRKNIDINMCRFMEDNAYKTKKYIPSIGEVFPLLNISVYTWNEISTSLLLEIFDRNVKWLLQKYPELGKINNINECDETKIIDLSLVDIEKEKIKLRKQLCIKYQQLSTEEYIKYKNSIDSLATNQFITEIKTIDWNMIDRSRIPKTFEANKISLKLVMFHIYFLRMFRNDDVNINDSLYDTMNTIDYSYGRITEDMEKDFQKQVKLIKEIDSFEDFFKYILIKKPSNEYFLKMLRQSVLNSLRKKYHCVMHKRKKSNIVKNKNLPTLNVDDL